MNFLNSALTSAFDLLLAPLERLGPATALIMTSGVFGVLALWVFKRISWQKGIKSVKDRIKGHMIEIRLYQDDLGIVAKAVGRVLLRNLQYVGLNFGPFVPLALPFLLIAAQLVVRYAYDPLPVVAAETRLLPGQGTLVEVELVRERREDVRGMRVELPAGVRALSPLVRALSEGRAYIEVVPVAAGKHELAFELADGTRATKLLEAGGSHPRTLQPRRVNARDWYRLHDPDHCAVLWPAEAPLASDSPFRSIALAYPHRDQGWLPEGEVGVLITFVVASMLFGFLALKPLGVQV